MFIIYECKSLIIYCTVPIVIAEIEQQVQVVKYILLQYILSIKIK